VALRLIVVMLVENGGPAHRIKFSPKQVNSLRSTAKVIQFERCQWGRLSENLDLEINPLTDFSLDGSDGPSLSPSSKLTEPKYSLCPGRLGVSHC
jgi:hypothetical protein